MCGHVLGARSPRALVVEDDPDVLALLGSHLRRLGCTVTLVATGEDALSSVAAHPPDLAVVDILLPGIDGRQLVDALRADPATSGCLVVATSVLEPEDIGRPCDAVLPKPFARRDVDRALRPLLKAIGKGE
jgi:CheY-like chemotaxis protein